MTQYMKLNMAQATSQIWMTKNVHIHIVKHCAKPTNCDTLNLPFKYIFFYE